MTSRRQVREPHRALEALDAACVRVELVYQCRPIRRNTRSEPDLQRRVHVRRKSRASSERSSTQRPSILVASIDERRK